MQKFKGRRLLGLSIGMTVLGAGILLVACSKDSPVTQTAIAPSATAPSDPNGAGVREDVRRYIETTYAGSAKTRAALFQYAKVTEKALADAGNKQLSIQHANESNRANTCLWYVRDSTKDARAIRLGLMPIILNTDDRNKAYLTYDSQLGGEVFLDIPYNQRASACDIDPSTLAN